MKRNFIQVPLTKPERQTFNPVNPFHSRCLLDKGLTSSHNPWRALPVFKVPVVLKSDNVSPTQAKIENIIKLKGRDGLQSTGLEVRTQSSISLFHSSGTQVLQS